MNSLKHGVNIAYIGAACRAYAALYLRCLVGNNIAVKVRQKNYLEVASYTLIHKVCGHNINVPIFGGNAGVILCNLVAKLGELAVGLLHNVSLCNYCNVGFAVVFSVLESGASNALCSLVGGNLKIESQGIGNFHAAAAENILALGVFTEEGPVNSKLGHGYGANVSIQVKLAAHCHVCAFKRAALKRGSRRFKNNVASLYFCQNVVGYSLIVRNAVFNGKPLNGAQLNFARGNFIL